MPRKKRRSGLFELDRVKEKIEEENVCFNRVKKQLCALQKFNVHDLYLVKGLSFTEDETLLTFQGVCNLRKAIQHVPSNIVNRTGKSLRALLIWDAFNMLCTSTNCGVNELSRYMEIMEQWCPNFLHVDESNIDMETSNKFISPEVGTCTKCDKILSMHNNLSTATLFTLDGPNYFVPKSRFSVGIALSILGCVISATNVALIFIQQTLMIIHLWRSAT
ncbi:Hypothetical predicted protein [Paramuricea clavata]|uniref:Uncharacterized protein n=1 Tax=Paramuricea clavata TaxID=317549 RepID=A0A6S7HZ31_PARCT|nr:Hypothetical predicted protein [Paramuricea clavata]